MTFPPELLRRCWFLAGPTAVGKTETSLHLAELLNAEIVSLDSMAVYRGMDIGTAKPDAAARKAVPHHLIDVADPHEEYSTVDYFLAAQTACQQIFERGKTPLFAGGTGLYLRTILRGICQSPPADWAFRHEMERRAAEQAPDWLLEQLRQVDPQRAEQLHPRDTRRIIRALEIVRLTGQKMSERHEQRPLPKSERPETVFWLHPPRDWLYARIDERVIWMIQSGLEAETRRLLAAESPPGRTARQALGYREMIDWIEGRIENRERMIELIQTRTRQFAKRQHTWFRNLEECREVVIDGSEPAQELARRLFRENGSVSPR